MALAGIELRYLVNRISEDVQDYYVSNIYGISRDSILFKLHHTEKDDIFMMISTSGIWLTGVKIDQIEPNRLQKRLRNDLLRLRLKKIEQVGAERIAYLTFAGFGKEFVMVGEFFGDGNIILCNEEMKILALQHSIDVRHRKLGVGTKYMPPPKNGMDAFDISDESFADLARTDLAAGKWFGRTFGLPKKYVEGVFRLAGANSKTAGSSLSEKEIQSIYSTAKKIIADVAEGRHETTIIRGEKTEVIPVNLGDVDEEKSTASSFMEGLDSVFTEGLVSRGKSMQSSGSEKKITELENQLSEQERAISTVKERSTEITKVANSIYQMISGGISSIEDVSAQKILESCNAKIITEKGKLLVSVSDQKIQINSQAPLHSIASVLFDEAKKQSGATSSIQIAMEKTKHSLDIAKSKAQSGPTIGVSEIRKKNWYERYRWFFTTDGMLAIGGRDAASNSAVVRKHLGKNDRIFHGEIFGSPFFILKNCQDVPASSMNEVANATVCFSRAWREGMYGLSAYWVNPEQVKKSAPSGQFLPKGSFTIEGQRNYVKISSLKLAVGITIQNDGHALTCGPPDTIKKNSICYAIIEPQGSEMADVAKKIRLEFLKLKEDITKKISIDEFVRALPAGQSQISDVGLGDVHIPEQQDF
ncbi:MAG: ribosome rescue protein RqcH [Thaumarchaeota archaeon]|nr:ribosome rescue protein RqcH [Nitrososphaerota archaeon]